MIPRALYKLARLSHVYTDFGVSESSLVSGLTSRCIPDIPREKITSFTTLAIMRSLKKKFGYTHRDLASRWLDTNQRFCREWLKRGFQDSGGLYAFNGAALECFVAGRKSGLLRVLDQTSAPMSWDRELLREEMIAWPGWQTQDIDSPSWHLMEEREQQEWEEASLIICGSDYVADSIKTINGPHTKCRVLPYGREPRQAVAQQASIAIPPKPGPLRVLYVGTLELRKGVPYLAEAARQMDPARFTWTAIGSNHLSEHGMKAFSETIHYQGSMAPSVMPHFYTQSDVVVLPSISEGSANVIYEALSFGVPVICSENSGAPFKDKEAGLIIPTRDTNALCAALELLEKDRAHLQDLSKRAHMFYASELSFDRYCERFNSILMDLECTS
jgi:glycosyltransferase involved in cell wall biosynthesis